MYGFFGMCFLDEVDVVGGVVYVGDDVVEFGEGVVEGGFGGILFCEFVEGGFGVFDDGVGGGVEFVGCVFVGWWCENDFKFICLGL